MKFLSLAPPFSIVLRLSIAVFQKYQVQFSDLPVVFCCTASRLLNKSKLCISIFTGHTSVHFPHNEEAKLKCLYSAFPSILGVLHHWLGWLWVVGWVWPP